MGYVRARIVDLPKANSLLSAIQSYKAEHVELLYWLDMEISFGEMVDDKKWQIQHSTLPFKEKSIVSFRVHTAS